MGCHRARQESLRDGSRGGREAGGGAGLAEALGVSQGERELGGGTAKVKHRLCRFLAGRPWLGNLAGQPSTSLRLGFPVCEMGVPAQDPPHGAVVTMTPVAHALETAVFMS